METNKKQKTFDAVKMMREIRNQISAETQNMTFEQLKEYIGKQLATGKNEDIRQGLKNAQHSS